jgi:hypothetical protein
LREATKAQEFPAPTLVLTIRPKGYEWQLFEAKRSKVPYKETVSETARMLQICGVVFVCFTN